MPAAPVAPPPHEPVFDMQASLWKCRKELYWFARKMFHITHEEAEDAVQETFVRAWTRRDSFDPSRSLQAWVNRILVNHLLDQWRRRNRIHHFHSLEALVEQFGEEGALNITEKAPSPETLFLDTQLSEPLEEAISTLSEKCRAAFLVSASDMNTQERLDWAQKQQVHPVTLRTRAVRARAQLRHLLRERKEE